MKISMVTLMVMMVHGALMIIIITSYKGMVDGYAAESWIQFKGHFYKSFYEEVGWDDAKKECEEQRGYLVEITSEQENNFIKDEIFSNQAYWIGLTVNPDIEGEHKEKFWWVEKRESPAFIAWGPNEPNDAGNDGEECANINENGIWNDYGCHRPLRFWCEKDTAESWRFQYKRSLYKSFSVKKSWIEAYEECKEQGGYLLEITSADENDFIKKHMTSDQMEPHWIGLRVNIEYGEVFHKDKFWWAETKAKPAFANWNTNEPNNYVHRFADVGEDCVEIRKNGFWNDNACYLSFGFWCEKERVDSWIPYKSHLYKSFHEAKPWENANTECKEHGGYLLEITSGDENNFIIDHISTDQENHQYWIGLKVNPDTVGQNVAYEDTFRWVETKAKPAFTLWGNNEPNNYTHELPNGNVGEECVEIHKDGKWNDNACYQLRRFWCEKERADLSGTNCTYPLSHNRKYPTLDFYDLGYMRDDSATNKTCLNYCDGDEKCMSVTYQINGEGRHYCRKFSISVQDLNNMGRNDEIFSKTSTSLYPTFITYDMHCAGLSSAKCTYPVSHDNKNPYWRYYKIDVMSNNTATAETCWAYCNKDVNCRSVRYLRYQDVYRDCVKYDISIQELKDTQRNYDIYHIQNADLYTTYKTYDRYCVCPPGLEPSSYLFGFCKPCSAGFFKASEGYEKCTECVDGEVSKNKTSCSPLEGNMCTGIYLVSDNGTSPNANYLINYKYQGINPTNNEQISYPELQAEVKRCQDRCNADKSCRSAKFEIYNDGRRFCSKYSISVQDQYNMWGDIETNTYSIPVLITYNRHCDMLRDKMCTNTYPVTHDGKSPDNRYKIDKKPDDSATPETCQRRCDDDTYCRSATYMVNNLDQRFCFKFRISVQDLLNMRKGDHIVQQLSTTKTYITYDRDCVCPRGQEPISYFADFCKLCSSGFFKVSKGNENCTKCENGKVSKNKTYCEPLPSH